MDTFARILYQKFFLRDVLGKVAPGGLVYLTLAQTLEPKPADSFFALQVPGVISSLVLFALFFLIGVALQVAGELLGLLSASPKPHHLFFLPVGWLRTWPACAQWWQINEDSAERLVRILRTSRERVGLEVISHWEYLAALKEGTGNLSLAVLIVLGTRWWVPGGVRGASMVVLLIFAFLLWSAQLLLAKRQARFEITVLARAGLLSPEETLAMGQHLGLKREQIPTGFRERRRA